MILKRRSKPIRLRKLELLLPRLRRNFAKYGELEYDLARRYKGYIGEKKVDYHIEQLADTHTILQSITLNTKGRNFEMDSIVISNYAIYIIETKNFNDTITFNTILNQFTRYDGQKEIGYRYPLTQAESSRLKLMSWLQERNTHQIPIHYFIAISDPSTVIKVVGNEEEIAKVVAHGEDIPRKILEMDKKITAQNQFKQAWNHHQIGKMILKSHKEQDFDIFGKYKITIHDIFPGVLCHKCEQTKMSRTHGTWCCRQCKHQSKLAHIKVIREFFLLIKPEITNRECRWYLQIKSRYLAIRIMKMAGLVYDRKRRAWVEGESSIQQNLKGESVQQ